MRRAAVPRRRDRWHASLRGARSRALARAVADAPSAARSLDDFEQRRRLDARIAARRRRARSSAPDAGVRTAGALRLDFDFAAAAATPSRTRKVVARSARELRVPLPRPRRGAAEQPRVQADRFDAATTCGGGTAATSSFPRGVGDASGSSKRQIAFAWGPAGGGELRARRGDRVRDHRGQRAARARCGSTTSRSSRCRRDRPTPAADGDARRRRARATSPALALDGDATTAWRSDAGDGPAVARARPRRRREFGGLVIDWDAGRARAGLRVEISADGATWHSGCAVGGGNGGRDCICCPRARRAASAAPAPGRIGARRVGVWRRGRQAARSGRDLERRSSPRSRKRARRAAPTRAVSCGEQCVLDGGRRGERSRARRLLDEDGALETGKRRFSIEPFLRRRTVGWSPGRTSRASSRSRTATCRSRRSRGGAGAFALEMTAFAFGDARTDPPALLRALSRRQHRATRRCAARLLLALRPFQVNPPRSSSTRRAASARSVDRVRTHGRCVVNGDAHGRPPHRRRGDRRGDVRRRRRRRGLLRAGALAAAHERADRDVASAARRLRCSTSRPRRFSRARSLVVVGTGSSSAPDCCGPRSRRLPRRRCDARGDRRARTQEA